MLAFCQSLCHAWAEHLAGRGGCSQTTCWVSPRPGLGWGGGLVLPKRSFLRKKAEAEKAHLSKDPNKSQASSNSPATLELEGGLAASRPPRRGGNCQLGSAGCDVTPSQRVAAPSKALGAVSFNYSRTFWGNALALAQTASSAFSFAAGKWVKQSWAL